MRKIIIFCIFTIVSISFSMLGGPCSMTEKKCVLIGFKVGGKVINENEISELKEIVSILNEFGEGGTVDFIGHTDSTGTKKYNQKIIVDKS